MRRLWTALLAVALLTPVTGCSQQYRLERLIWRADRAAAALLENDEVMSQRAVERVVALYEQAETLAGRDRSGREASFKIAQLYMHAQMYARARQKYDAIIALSENPEDQAAAAFEKARSYEKSGEWDTAREIFDRILISYGGTLRSLDVPLYIARHYVAQGDSAAAASSFDSARRHFTAIAERDPSGRLALVCENLIITTFMEQQQWERAAACLETTEKKYRLGPDTLLVLARMYRRKLNDEVRATAVYNRIIEEYPTHAVAKVAAIEKNKK